MKCYQGTWYTLPLGKTRVLPTLSSFSCCFLLLFCLQAVQQLPSWRTSRLPLLPTHQEAEGPRAQAVLWWGNQKGPLAFPGSP